MMGQHQRLHAGQVHGIGQQTVAGHAGFGLKIGEALRCLPGENFRWKLQGFRLLPDKTGFGRCLRPQPMINGQNQKAWCRKSGGVPCTGPAGGQMQESKRVAASRDGQRKRRKPLQRRQKTCGLVI